MQNQIECPNCNKTISNNPIIDDASKGSGSAERALQCDCGERISYWEITSLLRNQKTPVFRFKKWIRTLFQSRV